MHPAFNLTVVGLCRGPAVVLKDVQSSCKAGTRRDTNGRGRISTIKNRTADGESIQRRRLYYGVPIGAKR